MRAVVMAAVVALVVTGCARERYSTSYDDFIAARQQDAVDRGWIPDVLPEEATDLREVHVARKDLAVVRATLPGGIVPDGCTQTTNSIGAPALSADWIPDNVAAKGTPVQCGIWSGTIDGTTIVLWTDVAGQADAD